MTEKNLNEKQKNGRNFGDFCIFALYFYWKISLWRELRNKNSKDKFKSFPSYRCLSLILQHFLRSRLIAGSGLLQCDFCSYLFDFKNYAKYLTMLYYRLINFYKKLVSGMGVSWKISDNFFHVQSYSK